MYQVRTGSFQLAYNPKTHFLNYRFIDVNKLELHQAFSSYLKIIQMIKMVGTGVVIYSSDLTLQTDHKMELICLNSVDKLTLFETLCSWFTTSDDKDTSWMKKSILQTPS